MISTKKVIAAVVEGRHAAHTALAELAGVSNIDQRTALLADALGEQIDLCLGMNNLVPTECRLRGFADVLQYHLGRPAGLPPASKVPLKVARMPSSGVPKHE